MNTNIKRFLTIFIIFLLFFGYLAYLSSNIEYIVGSIFISLLYAIRINRLFTNPETKEPRLRRKPRYRQYDENRYANRDMEKIYKAYNIQKEAMEEDFEKGIDENFENTEDELISQNWYFTPTGFPFALAVLWLTISIIISIGFVELKELITTYFPFSFFIYIPILLLIGLSGVFGILFVGRNYDELSTEENAGFLINVIKIVTAWGIGIYIVIRHYFL